MTREEDLKEEGRITFNEYVRELGDYTFGEGSMVEMFVLGANYADQHPRKGLWDGEKVIEWIKNNAGSYLDRGVEYYPDTDDVLLFRCPKCGRENYALAVADGFCCWCGFNGRTLLNEKQ